MQVRRSRVVRAPADRVWEVVADPHHLPRWWPRTTRVEDVREEGWTSVLTSDRGRHVRADFVVTRSEPPVARRWEQRLAGTPFEQLLRESVTEVALTARGAGTEVTLALRQRPRGWARVGALMLRRAALRQLDEALDALARAVE